MANEQHAALEQAWYEQPSKDATTVAADLEALYRNGIQGMSALLSQAR